MRILDVDGNELQEETLDLELGHLEPDRLLIEHHDAIEAQERIFHYTVETFYFEDGSVVEIENENDPRIDVIDAANGHFGYLPAEGEGGKKLRSIQLKEIEDQPAIEAKEAWDEYEDIQRYILYTEEELAEREAERKRQEEEAEKQAAREEFLDTAPARLETTEADVSDLILIMADIIGGEGVE